MDGGRWSSGIRNNYNVLDAIARVTIQVLVMDKKACKVLVVDDDSTFLAIVKAHLKRWNYQVEVVNHAYDALCTLRDNPYDLVLSDVHMPNMDGFELQRHINREFCLPVILISSDTQKEVMCKGLQNGAQFFLVKPIAEKDVKDIYQFSVWWKNFMNKGTPPIRDINRSYQENAARNIAFPSDNIVTARTSKVSWTRDLHNRFVEALFVIGYHNAVPTTILEVMNAPELGREHVASHLQKYKRFLLSILDGSVDIENSHWIDLSYHSNSVSGNPHLMLINQLRDEQRTGKIGAPISAGNISSSSGICGLLPPFDPAEASSRRDMNAMWMPNNYASSVIGTAEGFGSANLGHVCNANMGNIVGSLTVPNTTENQMVYFDQNTLVAPQNNSYRNGVLVGGANNNMFPLANQIGTSSFAPFPDNFYSNQVFNLGGQSSNNLFNGSNITSGQQLGSGQMNNKILFHGHNINGGEVTEQLGSVQMNVQNFFDGQNIDAGQQLGSVQMNVQNFFDGQNIDGGQQLSGGEMTDQKGSDINEVLSPDNFLLGGSLFQDEDGEFSLGDIFNFDITYDENIGEDFLGDMMNLDVPYDENIGSVADEKEEYTNENDQNSGEEEDNNADYDPEKEC